MTGPDDRVEYIGTGLANAPVNLVEDAAPGLAAICADLVGPILSVHRLTGGNVSHVFRVQGGTDSVILKVRSDRFSMIPDIVTDPNLIADEYRALSVYGKYAEGIFPKVLSFNDDSHAMVMTDIFPGCGNYHDRLIRYSAKPEELRRFGIALNRIHEETANVRTSIRSQGDMWFRDFTIDYCIRGSLHERLARGCDEIRQIRSQQLILGDLSPKNISLAGGRVAICDLDNVHRGWKLFDIAYFLGHIMIHHAFKPAQLPGQVHNLLSGYFGTNSPGAGDLYLMAVVVAGVILYRVDGVVPYLLPLTEAHRQEIRDRLFSLLDSSNFGLENLVKNVGAPSNTLASIFRMADALA